MRLKLKGRALRRSREKGTRYLQVPVHIYLLPLPHEKATALMNVLKAAAATGEVPSGPVGLERDVAGIGVAIHERGLHRHLDLDWAGARLSNCRTDSALCVVFADNRDEPAVYVTCHTSGPFEPLMLSRNTSVSTKYHNVQFPPDPYYRPSNMHFDGGFNAMSMSIPGTSARFYDATTPADSQFHDFQFFGVIDGHASPAADVPGAKLISYDELCKVGGNGDVVENQPVLHAHCVLSVRENGWYLPDSPVWEKAVAIPY